MANLDRILKHYSKMAKMGRPLQGHYALGVADTLGRIKEVRDELQKDLDDLWKNRQGSPPQAKVAMTVLRAIINRINSIEDPQGDGT